MFEGQLFAKNSTQIVDIAKSVRILLNKSKCQAWMYSDEIIHFRFNELLNINNPRNSKRVSETINVSHFEEFALVVGGLV